MSLITRLFVGLVKSIDQATVPKFANEFNGYYVDCINDFYKSGYISAKIDDGEFSEFSYGEDKADSVNAYKKVLCDFLENCNYVNIGNLNISAFYLSLKLEKKDIIKAVQSSTNYFIQNAKDNPVKFFTPSVISSSTNLDKTAEDFKNFIESYLLSSALELKILSKHNILNDPLYYLEFFKNFHFENLQIKVLIESFITTYMYGIGGLKAGNKNLLFNEFLFSHEISEIKKVIDFNYLLTEDKWDELTISAYRKNPKHLGYIEKLSNNSKGILSQFTTKDQFFSLFKAHFFLQLLSDTEINLDTIEKFYEEYYSVIKEHDLIEIIYCFYVILSIPKTDLNILFERLNSSALCVYNYNSNYRPIYSVV
ncbi:MAG: hypothetical protein HWE07_05030 [Cytophagia bacterium]|nr:hypothetical protein [Cytophagia bacterium]